MGIEREEKYRAPASAMERITAQPGSSFLSAEGPARLSLGNFPSAKGAAQVSPARVSAGKALAKNPKAPEVRHNSFVSRAPNYLSGLTSDGCHTRRSQQLKHCCRQLYCVVAAAIPRGINAANTTATSSSAGMSPNK
jgi:hypothetical protein